MSLALMVMDPRPAVLVGRVASLMLTVDGTRQTHVANCRILCHGGKGSLFGACCQWYTPSTHSIPAMVFVYEIMY